MEPALGGGAFPLEPSPEEAGDEGVPPIPYLLGDAAGGPAELFEHDEAETLKGAGLKRALESLDERSRRIISARWLAESKAKTLHELAGEFGVSAERIRQIEAKAMQKMKRELAALQ